MNYMMKESLKKQSKCPRCKANWLSIEDSIKTYDKLNFTEALVMIGNCPTCLARFEDRIGELKYGS